MQRNNFVALALIITSACSLGAGCTACDGAGQAHAQAGDAGRPTPFTGLDCLTIAERRTGLTELQLASLCTAAPTPTGPVDCFATAQRRLMLTDDQAVILCRCSPSTEPVACWEAARRRSRLTDVQMMQLCSPTLALGLLPNCGRLGY